MINTELLKKKVLDLAMRGKLVEQDPSEGNARDLLKKIKIERKRLVDENKIKEVKALAPITSEEMPYVIPDSWEWVRASQILQVTMGQSPKKETVNSVKEGFEFHQGKSLFSDKYIGHSDVYTTSSNKLINPPAVVMSVRAPVGDVNLINRSIFIGRGLASFQSIYNIDVDYTYYYLSTVKKNLEKVATGTTFKAINSSVVNNILIPIPPFDEQKRITTQINQLFQLIDHLADQQNKFSQYQELLQDKALELAMQGKLVPQISEEGTAATLLEEVQAERQKLVVEKKIKKTKSLPEITEDEIPYVIPESWEWVRLGEVSTMGKFESIKSAELDVQKNVIELENIEKKSGRLLNIQKVSEKESKSSKYVVKKGDILYGKLRPYLKKILISPISGYCSTEIYPFTSVNNIINEYLLAVVKSVYFQNIINNSTQGINLPRVNHKVMSNIVIPLPPTKEQERIVNKLVEINQAVLLNKSQ